uniref:dipeptidyl peptidase 4-like isoform X1 n=1 Tax=Styela clava TaxID=7725 RepID=UPI0019397478|nr:dipeptidyl peptidase 4-like isoform X1 [Styela clava]
MARLKLTIALGFMSVVAVLCITAWNIRGQDEKEEHLVKKDVEPMGMVQERADNKLYMTFDDWLSGTFRYSTVYPNWVSDSEYAYRTSEGAIMKKNISSEDESILLDETAWKSVSNPSSYSISADMEYVAITYENTDGYAHYMKTFSVDVFSTSDSSKQTIPNFPADKIQKIKWDPIGHKMAFVHEFDIYVIPDLTASPVRITNDGKENVKFNGITDWLHYVEITNDDALLWWSPSGSYLAYATLDQTNVKNFDFAIFGGLQYPNMISFPYPKPGTPLPQTKTFVIDMSGPINIYEAAPSTEVTDWGEYYLNSAIWRSDNMFTPTWKNRFENESVSESCEAASGFTCSHVSNMETSSSTGWLGHYKPADLVRMPDEDKYMTVLSDSTGFPHIAVVNAQTDNKDWRTSGNFEVTDTGSGDQAIFFYDETNEWIYYTSTEKAEESGEGLPRIRHLWRVKSNTDGTRECISCHLNTLYADRCNWVRPTFSPGGSYVVVNCGGTANGAPISTLHSISNTGEIDFVRVVQNNSQLIENMDAYHFRTREFGELTLPGVDGTFYYTLHKPPNFDETKKYPMLVQVYSGPAYQEVVERFSVSWKDYVASTLDVIVMSFDGRGTGFRGDEIMHQVYMKLGQYEPADQIAAAKLLAAENDFIDESKTAIWGWSYGGYATTRTIEEDSEGVFKCGYAVAPVTDWEFYHTIYTERYMKNKIENEIGYNRSTTMQKFENFKNHQYYIFHGTADENVHFQNAARLTMALIENDVDFGAFYAADDNHSMANVKNSYRNIYKMITKQMCRCFNLDKPDTGVICGPTSEARKDEKRRLRRRKRR